MGWALRWVRCTVPCWLRKKRVCEWSNLLGLESEPVVGWEMINPKPTEIRKKQIVRWTEVESRSKDFLIFLESDPSSSAWISIYSITISLRLKSRPRKRETVFPLGFIHSWCWYWFQSQFFLSTSTTHSSFNSISIISPLRFKTNLEALHLLDQP